MEGLIFALHNNNPPPATAAASLLWLFQWTVIYWTDTKEPLTLDCKVLKPSLQIEIQNIGKKYLKVSKVPSVPVHPSVDTHTKNSFFFSSIFFSLQISSIP